MNDVLILRLNNSDYFFHEIKAKPPITAIYKKLPKALNYLLKKKGRLYVFTYLFLETWKKEIRKFNVVVIFDFGYSKDISKYIKKRNKKCKVILFFFNPILFDYQRKWMEDKNIDEIWSFDHVNVEKYNLRYNSTFFIKPEYKFKYKLIYDIIFLGREKGRREVINEVVKEFNKNKFKTWIKITHADNETVSYKYYINKLIESKCILDVTQENQEGLSLRFMESLFFQKKIITNNKYVVNYDFYNPNNIFVIGVDNYSQLKEFINSPYIIVKNEIREYYLYENWVKRFLEDENKCN